MSSARWQPIGFTSTSALTIPSSGRAFGTPLKSNVRALSSSIRHVHETSQYRRAGSASELFVCRFVPASGILRRQLRLLRASPANRCVGQGLHTWPRATGSALESRSHLGKSTKASLLGSKSASEERRITLRSREPNLKCKTQFTEHEFGTVVAIRLQLRERPNQSIKRTCLRHAAYVQR